MTNHGRPVGPEERTRPTPDIEPAVRADTTQPSAADAFRDIPGTDDPDPRNADGTLDETAVPAPDAFRAVVGAPTHPATLGEATPSPAEAARAVLGVRDPLPYLEDELQLDTTPAEEGYHCPVCMYLHESEPEEEGGEGELDERLEWSDTRTMIVCTECERDYPAALCCPDLGDSTTIYLASVAEVTGVAVDRERDRAALWAGELAEIEHVLAGVVDVGATPDEHVGARLPERVAAIIGAAYDQGVEQGRLDTAAEVAGIVRDGIEQDTPAVVDAGGGEPG